MRSTEILSVRLKRSIFVELRAAASRQRLSRNAFCAQALNKAVLETLKEGDSTQKLGQCRRLGRRSNLIDRKTGKET